MKPLSKSVTLQPEFLGIAVLVLLAASAWIRSNVPAKDALSGWGWFVPWHIAFLSDRLPAQIHLETKELRGLSDWFVLSPEVEWSGCMDDRLRDFLARQGPPVFEQRFYPVYRVTWQPTTEETDGDDGEKRIGTTEKTDGDDGGERIGTTEENGVG